MTVQQGVNTDSAAITVLMQPSLLRISLVLAYTALISIFISTLGAMVIPTEMSFFLPGNAALANGLLLGSATVMNIAAPVVGVLVDRFGSRRPPLLLGASCTTVGLSGMLISVQSRTAIALAFFCTSFLVTMFGCVALATLFSAIVADVSERLPEKRGAISGIFGLYQLLGSAFGLAAAGAICPIQRDSHTFYWVLLAIMVIGNLGLLMIPKSLIDPSENVYTTKTSYREWFGEDYAVWRLVVVARLVFFLGVGTFGSLALFFLEDCTNAAGPKEASFDYMIIGITSIGCSLLVTWPAAKLSDKMGPALVAIFGTIVQGSVMGCMPFMHSTILIMIVVPLYGLGQQFYNIGDLALITTACPSVSTRARDMGGWSAMMSAGQALGSFFAGATVAAFKDPRFNATNATLHGDEVRSPYERSGYISSLLPGGVCTVFSALFLLLAQRRAAARASDATTGLTKSLAHGHAALSSGVLSDVGSALHSADGQE